MRTQQKILCSLLLFPLFLLLGSLGKAQLRVLSEGNKLEKWQETQIALLASQLGQAEILGNLKEEVVAQKKWLEAWVPGELAKAPLWKQTEVKGWLVEPALDPNERASALRARLLGPKARPTAKDTRRLEELLAKYPQDVGVRQLHLHWLDQKQYRKTYTVEIAEAAEALAGILQSAKEQTRQLKLARAFCLYRAGRALAYRELPEVSAANPIEDIQAYEGKLLGTYAQLTELVGKGRPEFILLEVRLLRRDRWFGRALALLEGYGKVIEPQWFLKKRRDLLKELGWEGAYEEAAEIYAKEFPEAAAEEEKQS